MNKRVWEKIIANKIEYDYPNILDVNNKLLNSNFEFREFILTPFYDAFDVLGTEKLLKAYDINKKGNIETIKYFDFLLDCYMYRSNIVFDQIFDGDKDAFGLDKEDIDGIKEGCKLRFKFLSNLVIKAFESYIITGQCNESLDMSESIVNKMEEYIRLYIHTYLYVVNESGTISNEFYNAYNEWVNDPINNPQKLDDCELPEILQEVTKELSSPLKMDGYELSEFRQELAKEMPLPISTEDKIRSIQDDLKNLPITYRVSHISTSNLIANQ